MQSTSIEMEHILEGGGSTNPLMNSQLRSAIEIASKKNMPNSTIQTVLKKCAGQTANIKRSIVEIRHGKVFVVIVLYTDNLVLTKNNFATLLRKTGAIYCETLHMFYEKGILEVVGNDKINANTDAELEEIATEHAIECGAEEIEIVDANTRHLTVKGSCYTHASLMSNFLTIFLYLSAVHLRFSRN